MSFDDKYLLKTNNVIPGGIYSEQQLKQAWQDFQFAFAQHQLLETSEPLLKVNKEHVITIKVILPNPERVLHFICSESGWVDYCEDWMEKTSTSEYEFEHLHLGFTVEWSYDPGLSVKQIATHLGLNIKSAMAALYVKIQFK